MLNRAVADIIFVKITDAAVECRRDTAPKSGTDPARIACGISSAGPESYFCVAVQDPAFSAHRHWKVVVSSRAVTKISPQSPASRACRPPMQHLGADQMAERLFPIQCGRRPNGPRHAMSRRWAASKAQRACGQTAAARPRHDQREGLDRGISLGGKSAADMLLGPCRRFRQCRGPACRLVEAPATDPFAWRQSVAFGRSSQVMIGLRPATLRRLALPSSPPRA